MSKDEIINNTLHILKNINSLADKIKEVAPGERLPYELFKVKQLIGSIEHLSIEEQLLIEYKYFKRQSSQIIGNQLHMSSRTVNRKLKKIVLDIGRMTFGFEKEFFRCII